VVGQEHASSVQSLVGSALYEQARGILIGAFGCTADEAANLIGTAAAAAGMTPKDLVSQLVSVETRRSHLRAIAEDQTSAKPSA
jgi:hypothetical protein